MNSLENVGQKNALVDPTVEKMRPKGNSTVVLRQKSRAEKCLQWLIKSCALLIYVKLQIMFDIKCQLHTISLLSLTRIWLRKSNLRKPVGVT